MKNKADSLVYAAEKMISEHKDKPYSGSIEKESEKLHSEAEKLRSLIKDSGSIEDIRQKQIDIQNAIAEFNKAVSQFAETPASEGQAGNEANNNGDDVIDADFKATSVD